jgi:hypothetical protein
VIDSLDVWGLGGKVKRILWVAGSYLLVEYVLSSPPCTWVADSPFEVVVNSYHVLVLVHWSSGRTPRTLVEQK